MKRYIRPEVLELEDIAEGIYADGSGEVVDTPAPQTEDPGTGAPAVYDGYVGGDCYTTTVEPGQSELQNPSEHFKIYQITAVHHSVKHISSHQRIVLAVNNANYTNVTCQGFNVNKNGTEISIDRDGNMADAYGSGDKITVNVRFDLPLDDPKAAFFDVVGATTMCTHATNEHGEID